MSERKDNSFRISRRAFLPLLPLGAVAVGAVGIKGIITNSSARSYTVANLVHRQDLQRAAQEFINPEYFPNGVSLPPEEEVGYEPEDRVAHSFAPGRGQHFIIENQYRMEGGLQVTRLKPGVYGPPPLLRLESIPGMPLTAEEFNSQSPESYSDILSRVYQLPSDLHWEMRTIHSSILERSITTLVGQGASGTKYYRVSMGQDRSAPLMVSYL